MIYKIDDGNANCHAMAFSEDQALALQEVKDYFAESEERGDLVISAVDPDKEMKITFEGVGAVELKAKFWDAIYETSGGVMVCASEY